MKAFLQVLRDIALLLARCLLGGVLVMNGWRSWIREGMQAKVNDFTDLGVPEPQLFAWSLVIVQFVCGVLLIVGLLTPIAGALVVIMSGLVIFFAQFGQGLWVDQGGYEYSLVTIGLALLLTAFGGGRAALDMLFKRDVPADARDDVFEVDDTTPA
ncbi:DoxX family protein [Enemella sp. A6]|uniref:DoxX family protein n=1 Tax=Enemella sp. A6 TaxID=3440152 RepID=UPI003EB7F6AC